MVRSSIALLGAALHAATVAAKCCTNLTIPVTVSARNAKFNLAPPANNIDVADFALKLARRGANYTQEVFEEFYTVSGTYNIAATYCSPSVATHHEPGDSVLQILTHGIGFDKSYWDFPYANYNYSYVNQALAMGYSTFSYDRFGIGGSFPGNETVDPINEVQSSLEIAILEQLTIMLRGESGGGGSYASLPIPKFAKTVHVGHSYGSIQTYALGAMRPDLSDGLILTGFTQVADYTAYFLLGANFVNVDTVPSLASKYMGEGVRGYIAPQNLTGVQQNFFSPGMFSPKVLEVAGQTGQPVTYGELLTLGAPAGVMSEFAGPVLIITGDYDIPFCGGNCTTGNSSFLDVSASLLKKASPFETFVVPKAGHGLNLEYSWPTTYGKILDFLGKYV